MDLDRTLLAKKFLGETLEGTITGAASFGLFVTIDAPFVEGLVPVQTMPDDYYEQDEYGAMLIGQRTGRTFALGDRVKVVIAAAYISRRKVELQLADMPSTSGRRGAPRKKRASADTQRPRGKKSGGRRVSRKR